MSAAAVSALRDRLSKEFPALRMKLDVFPSGGAMLDVFLQQGAYVVEHLPSVGPGFGVSKMETATFGFEGFEHYFEDIAEAEAFLRCAIASVEPR